MAEWTKCSNCDKTGLSHAMRGLRLRCYGHDGPVADFSLDEVIAIRRAIGKPVTIDMIAKARKETIEQDQ